MIPRHLGARRPEGGLPALGLPGPRQGRDDDREDGLMTGAFEAERAEGGGPCAYRYFRHGRPQLELRCPNDVDFTIRVEGSPVRKAVMACAEHLASVIWMMQEAHGHYAGEWVLTASQLGKPAGTGAGHREGADAGTETRVRCWWCGHPAEVDTGLPGPGAMVRYSGTSWLCADARACIRRAAEAGL